MGGIGSGRHFIGARSTTTDYLNLDVRKLKRDGILVPGLRSSVQWKRRSGAFAEISILCGVDRLTLIYKNKRDAEDWEDLQYPIQLDYTECSIGGRRVWFRCPAVGCGRRVAILYGGRVFVCRHCHRLVYDSQRESGPDRVARKLDKIRKRLSWPAGFLNGIGDKPKGMRWRTYYALFAKHQFFANRVFKYFSGLYGLEL